MAAVNANHSPEPPPASEPEPTSAHLGYPILVISIIGILIMSLLLVSYYAFAIKCSPNSRYSDTINRFVISRQARRRRRRPGSVVISSNSSTGVGLEEYEIRAIPIVQFRKFQENCECSICLTEFDDYEKLKFLPNCAHVFHIDCIDTWLQANLNCPICRSNITISAVNLPTPPQKTPSFITVRSLSSMIVVVDDDASVSVSISPILDIPVASSTLPVTMNRNASLVRELNITAGEKAEEFNFLRPMRRSVSMDILRNNEEEDENDGRHLFCSGDYRGESSTSSSILPIHGELELETRTAATKPPEMGRR